MILVNLNKIKEIKCAEGMQELFWRATPCRCRTELPPRGISSLLLNVFQAIHTKVNLRHENSATLFCFIIMLYYKIIIIIISFIIMPLLSSLFPYRQCYKSQ